MTVTAISICCWLGMALAAFALVWCLFPAENIGMLLGSHLSQETRAAFADGPVFQTKMLVRDWEMAVIAGLGGLIVLGRWRGELLFPLVLGGTVFVIHSLNRPFWFYYWLHFAVPLAWLAGIAIRELFDLFWNSQCRDFQRRVLNRGWAHLLWAVAVSLALVSIPLKLRSGFERVSFVHRVEMDSVVLKLTAWGDGVNWVYARRPIYAFHAGIPLPPELAVLSRKRFASGQIDWAKVLEIVNRYKPELILLSDYELDAEWSDFLESGYQQVDQHGSVHFFLKH